MPKLKTPSPARLFPFLATDAPVGLIIRRGPSAYMGCIAWNRTDDTFIYGQYMKGRIYEELCDLSPDGKHFIYASLSYDSKSDFLGNLTAVSRVPFLKGLAVYDAYLYQYGGIFTSNNTFWLQTSSHVNFVTGRAPHDPFTCERSSEQFKRDLYFDGKLEYDLTDYDHLTIRPLKLGWTVHSISRNAESNKILHIIFEKKLSESWFLRKTVLNDYGAHSKEKFTLFSSLSKESTPLNWEWGDVDRERLVWVSKGCLFTARISKYGLSEERILHDFNLMRFSSVAAPY